MGLTFQFYAQVVNDGMLPEVEVRAVNYKYLNSTDNSEAPVPVKLLQDMVAKFDLKSSEFYEDGTDLYKVYFFIPEGKIVAAYDRDGKILYTVEKFKDIALPHDLATSLAERFPGWQIEKDIYRINYSAKKGAKHRYKIMLKNGDKVLRVKMNEDGAFL